MGMGNEDGTVDDNGTVEVDARTLFAPPAITMNGIEMFLLTVSHLPAKNLSAVSLLNLFTSSLSPKPDRHLYVPSSHLHLSNNRFSYTNYMTQGESHLRMVRLRPKERAGEN
jgi:hypothetical protein